MPRHTQSHGSVTPSRRHDRRAPGAASDLFEALGRLRVTVCMTWACRNAPSSSSSQISPTTPEANGCSGCGTADRHMRPTESLPACRWARTKF